MNKVIESFFVGGASLLVILLAISFNYSTDAISSFTSHYLYLFGVFLALAIYQPHFLATYKLAYRYKVNSNLFVLLILPAILCLFILFILFNDLFNLGIDISDLLRLMLVFTLFFAALHFSKQSYGALLYYQQNKLPANVKLFFKWTLCLVPFYGVLNLLSLSHGKVSFFSIDLALDYDLSIFLNLLFYSLIFLYCIGLYLLTKYKGGVNSFIIYISFFCWYSIDTFAVKYFYFIPLFHSLQFLPFYFRKVSGSKKAMKWGGLVFFSFIFIFLLPNFLSITFPRLIGRERGFSHLFVVVLLAVNLHHFAMENFFWKKEQIKI